MNDSLKKILVSPLEWGLGHTARTVRVIDHLISLGHIVVLASDGLSLRFLRFRFPQLPWVRLSFHQVSYPKNSRLVMHLLLQIPSIIRSIRQNRKELARIISQYQIDIVVSDHRYGMHHPSVSSVFITTQLWLKAPRGWEWGEKLVYNIHKLVLRRFNQIWIADFPDIPGISGKLTHPPRLPGNARYIFPVSRMLGLDVVRPENADPPEVLAIISGPEPQRSILEEKISTILLNQQIKATILRGLPPADPSERPAEEQNGPVRMISHASDPHLAWYLLSAGKIICRPGISNLSDLVTLGKTAILVPTPGQTEQEYPAQQLGRKKFFKVCQQEDLSFEAIKEFNPQHFGRFPEISGKELTNAIDTLLANPRATT